MEEHPENLNTVSDAYWFRRINRAFVVAGAPENLPRRFDADNYSLEASAMLDRPFSLYPAGLTRLMFSSTDWWDLDV